MVTTAFSELFNASGTLSWYSFGQPQHLDECLVGLEVEQGVEFT